MEKISHEVQERRIAHSKVSIMEKLLRWLGSTASKRITRLGQQSFYQRIHLEDTMHIVLTEKDPKVPKYDKVLEDTNADQEILKL